MSNEHKMILGRFASPYGVRGWIKVVSYTFPPENLLHYTTWQVKRHGQWETYPIKNARPHGKFIVVKLIGCDTPEDARQFIHAEIAVNRSDIPELKQNEFYWADLIGLNVITIDHIKLGHVDSLINTGANDVLIVKNVERERLIPYIKSVIKSVDLAKRIITIDWDPDF